MAKARKNFSTVREPQPGITSGIPRDEGRQFLEDASAGRLPEVKKFVEKYGVKALEISDAEWDIPDEPPWEPYRRTPLCLAARGGGRDVVEYLIAEGANVNVSTRLGLTPLMLARNPAVAELLLAAGADIHQTADGGLTVLMVPTTPEMLTWFAAHGADLEARDDRGRTALMHAVDGETARMRAEMRANLIALLDAGADPNARDDKGCTALMCAVSTVLCWNGGPRSDADILSRVQLLVSRGADPELRDNAGSTAGMLARSLRADNPDNQAQLIAAADYIDSEIARRQERVQKLFTEGAAQNMGIMRPLQFRLGKV